MEDVRRRFGGVVALAGARLSLSPGEVHAVLGENGAGKTTLLRILAGLLRPDSGALFLSGERVQLRSARHAWAHGIAMVHQHFSLVPRLTVLENLALGSRARWRPPLERVRGRASELMERTGLRVGLDDLVETLGVGDRQRVEILRALLKDPDVLILDEPTAVLAPPEVDGLLALLRSLAARGATVVLVAHKLDEVLSVADRVTVLREGRTLLEAPRGEVDVAALVRAMVGEATAEAAAEVSAVGPAPGPSPPARSGDGAADAPRSLEPASAGSEQPVVARLEGVRLALRASGRPALQGVDLEVRRGEVVGIVGVEGNGQRELALVLAGRLLPDAGSVRLPPDPAFIPQDRAREGLVGAFSLVENLALALHRDPSYRVGPLLRWGRLGERAQVLMRAFDVRAPGPATRADALSGGNQQRLVVARELGRSPDFLVAENPTRGLDVAAAAFVHGLLRGHAAVVLISGDLDEVLRLSDRVLVMVRGRLFPVPPEARSREAVGRLMLSGGAEEAPEQRALDGPEPGNRGAAR